jgi:Uma2 family endonuclease
MSTVRNAKHSVGEPAWDVATLFPGQGYWSEEEYLDLPTNRLVEFTRGHVEVLPMPTTSHQIIVALLFRLLETFVERRKLGTVLFAALPVRLWEEKYREPDVVFLLSKHAQRIGEQYWEGADLVMEVVSDDAKSRHRDLVMKRREYARAGILEYWIVDPLKERITVLRLAGRKYVVHGSYGRGDQACSALLDGFEVAVAAVFAAASRGGKRPRSKR